MLLIVSDSSAQTADLQQALLLFAAVNFTEMLQSHLHSAKHVIQQILRREAMQYSACDLKMVLNT